MDHGQNNSFDGSDSGGDDRGEVIEMTAMDESRIRVPYASTLARGARYTGMTMNQKSEQRLDMRLTIKSKTLVNRVASLENKRVIEHSANTNSL